MEVKSRCSFLGYGRTELLSSVSHCAGWVDAVGAQDRPLFMLNVVSHGSSSEKADVLSPPLNNPVIPRSEKEGTKPPYVCPGCSNHTYGQQYGEQIQYLVKLQTRIFTK
jgi:hypothetical protein